MLTQNGRIFFIPCTANINTHKCRNDILRKHKIIPERPPSPSAKIEEALVEAHRLAHENRLEGKDLEELDELEDEEDEEFLQGYRNKRMQELADIRSTSVYNQVYPIQKVDYAKDVTEESNKTHVFVLLTSSSGTNTESRLLIELWRELAHTFGHVKFCQMQGNLCIQGYPDRNTPTILIYKDTQIVRQIVTLKELRSEHTTRVDLEGVLRSVGAVKADDSRLQSRNQALDNAHRPPTSRDDDSESD